MTTITTTTTTIMLTILTTTTALILIFMPLYDAKSTSNAVPTNGSTIDDDSLLLVQLLFRHGDRTPISYYPNDPYLAYPWNEGNGMLTLAGKRRMFGYGEVLRKRYANYIAPNRLLNKNIVVKSSPKRRCLESTLAVLAGLFPPKSQEQIWSQDTELAHRWQPIAVETVESSRAWLLNQDSACPRADSIKENFPQTNERLRKFLADNATFIRTVEYYVGKNFTNWLQIGYIHDTITTEQHYFGAEKYVMPTWLAKVGNNTLERLGAFHAMEFAIYGESREFIQLKTGPFLYEMLQNMQSIVNNRTSFDDDQQRKVFIYGSHDSMLAYIIHALGLYQGATGGQPTYGSGLIFELRQPLSSSTSLSTTEPQVYLYYANNTANYHIYQLKLNESNRFGPYCPLAHCALSAFGTALSNWTVDDPEKACAF